MSHGLPLALATKIEKKKSNKKEDASQRRDANHTAISHAIIFSLYHVKVWFLYSKEKREEESMILAICIWLSF